MFTILHDASVTLSTFIQNCLSNEPVLSSYFDGASGGTMEVSRSTPDEMATNSLNGVSIWLYSVVRDAESYNRPHHRPDMESMEPRPLPLCAHYLVTPVIDSTNSIDGPELEHIVLGKVLQSFHDTPVLRGTDLQAGLTGTDTELHVRLESLSLENIVNIWDAMDRSYQLSVSYEVSVVILDSAKEKQRISPVLSHSSPIGVITSKVP